ncbi:uncharacterized protein LOC117587672 [Drosophila guanche]|uniref:Uncharacterized protein n=1 Tax=Drosophila guanche TaxID=7266 RepID=A0A3B0KLB1_DROGU|nr:uncharacterized protein LOC117587672 [Drosophila guanche]SPP85871.1 Hypothetical predicted protein [Drosophila guanche]
MSRPRPTVLERLRQLNNAELFLLCQDYRIMVGRITFTNRRHVERLLTVAVIGDRARARVHEQLARERGEGYSRTQDAREVPTRHSTAPRKRRSTYQRESGRNASTMTTPSVHLLSSEHRTYWPSVLPPSMRNARNPPLWRQRVPQQQQQQGSSIIERALDSVRRSNLFGFRVPFSLWRYASRGLGCRGRRTPTRFRGGQGEEIIDLGEEHVKEDVQYELREENRYSEASQELFDERYVERQEERQEDRYEDQFETEDQVQYENEAQYRENENEDLEDMPYPGEPSNYGATRFYSREGHGEISQGDQSEAQRQLEWQLNSTYGEGHIQDPFNSPHPYDFQELAQLNLMDRLDRIDQLNVPNDPPLALRDSPQIATENESDSSVYFSISNSSTSFYDTNEPPVHLVRAQAVKKRFDWFGWMKIAPRTKSQSERIAKRDQTREQNLEHERELCTIDYLSEIDSRALQDQPLLELMSRHELRHSSEEDDSSIGSCGDLQPGLLRRTFELLFCDRRGAVNIKKLRCSLFCCCVSIVVYVSFKMMH